MDEEGKDQEVAQSEELGNFPGLEVLGTLEGPSVPQGTHRVSLSFVLFFWNRDVEMVTQKHCLVALVVNGNPFISSVTCWHRIMEGKWDHAHGWL